ncbi:S41 family peptidase [Chitinophaga sancti]|uniref:S41 family peptidase n=1 Tax=Chitinophaga sancti TaxID=1004 RepID=UPI002A75F6CE|nr:S41 family peptidase [Chitinophaga sancti]WPQ65135.1 S41 family peptidase [Chitinophaga sancti]
MLRPSLIGLTVLLCVVACRKEDTPDVTPTGPVTQAETNKWILDSMRYFYLWNSYLPSSVDTTLSTTDYFASLKYTDDRFSFLYNPNDNSTYPKYMLYQYGIEFAIISGSNGPVGVIELVIPSSVAALNGIKRGDYFTAINGTTITSSNATELTTAMLKGSSSTLTMESTGEDITLPAQSLGENPIYQQDIFLVNNKVVAYLFYNYFNDTYNTALQQVFQSFKTAGASELILDLRYNPGGSVAAAALLNAMIAPDITEQSIFAKYTGNSQLGSRNISYKSAFSVPESGSAISFSKLSDKRLSLSRVFILSGAATASAAELTINSLKPYTQVIQIGETTYGKDKGAVIISDTRSPQRISWTLMPITYNLFNAAGTGGYTSGITPNYSIDEMSSLPLTAIGDTNDPLIARAIAIINGNGRISTTNNCVKHYYNSPSLAAQKEIVKIVRSPL